MPDKKPPVKIKTLDVLTLIILTLYSFDDNKIYIKPEPRVHLLEYQINDAYITSYILISDSFKSKLKDELENIKFITFAQTKKLSKQL